MRSRKTSQSQRHPQPQHFFLATADQLAGLLKPLSQRGAGVQLFLAEKTGAERVFIGDRAVVAAAQVRPLEPDSPWDMLAAALFENAALLCIVRRSGNGLDVAVTCDSAITGPYLARLNATPAASTDLSPDVGAWLWAIAGLFEPSRSVAAGFNDLNASLCAAWLLARRSITDQDFVHRALKQNYNMQQVTLYEYDARNRVFRSAYLNVDAPTIADTERPFGALYLSVLESGRRVVQPSPEGIHTVFALRVHDRSWGVAEMLSDGLPTETIFDQLRITAWMLEHALESVVPVDVPQETQNTAPTSADYLPMMLVGRSDLIETSDKFSWPELEDYEMAAAVTPEPSPTDVWDALTTQEMSLVMELSESSMSQSVEAAFPIDMLAALEAVSEQFTQPVDAVDNPNEYELPADILALLAQSANVFEEETVATTPDVAREEWIPTPQTSESFVTPVDVQQGVPDTDLDFELDSIEIPSDIAALLVTSHEDARSSYAASDMPDRDVLTDQALAHADNWLALDPVDSPNSPWRRADAFALYDPDERLAPGVIDDDDLMSGLDGIDISTFEEQFGDAQWLADALEDVASYGASAADPNPEPVSITPLVDARFYASPPEQSRLIDVTERADDLDADFDLQNFLNDTIEFNLDDLLADDPQTDQMGSPDDDMIDAEWESFALYAEEYSDPHMFDLTPNTETDADKVTHLMQTVEAERTERLLAEKRLLAEQQQRAEIELRLNQEAAARAQAEERLVAERAFQQMRRTSTLPLFLLDGMRLFMTRVHERLARVRQVLPAQSGNGSQASTGQLVAQVVEETRSTLDILGDLALVARLEKGQQDLIAFTALVQNALHNISQQAANRRVRIQTQIEEDVRLLGDEAALGQAVFNLLLTAVGGTKVGATLHVDVNRNRDFVTMLLWNTGTDWDQKFIESQMSYFSPTGVPNRSVVALARAVITYHAGTLALSYDAQKARLSITMTLPTQSN